jgi:hypothetical protein
MRRPVALLGSILLACSVTAAVHAAQFSLSIAPATATASAVTLNGVDQVSTFAETISVTGGSDTTGWQITAWAPLPTSGANVLGALVVPTQPTLGACSLGQCSLPIPTGITWPVTLGTTALTAAKIYNAGVGSGNKNNTVNVSFGVNIPAGALAGSYTTTLTIVGAESP